MKLVIISAGILKLPVGHLRGEQIFLNFFYSSAAQRLSGRNWMEGDGAFALEAWGRSCLQLVEPTNWRASRPNFSDSRGFA